MAQFCGVDGDRDEDRAANIDKPPLFVHFPELPEARDELHAPRAGNLRAAELGILGACAAQRTSARRGGKESDWLWSFPVARSTAQMPSARQGSFENALMCSRSQGTKQVWLVLGAAAKINLGGLAACKDTSKQASLR